MPGMSPQGQNALNAKQRVLMQNMFDAILSGDPNQINIRLSTFGPQQGPGGMSTGLNEYQQLFQQIASDYVNMGGISPETKALIDAQQQSKGWSTSKPEKQSAAMAGYKTFKDLAKSLPVVTNLPSGGKKVQMLGIPPGMSQQDYMQLYVTNESLANLDPVTKQQTQEWLARANPMLFRAYGMQAPPATPAGALETGPTAESLNKVAAGLDFNKLKENLVLQPRVKLAGNVGGTGSSLAWMKNYLQTAATGIEGTREQQLLAANKLGSLEQEAKGNNMGQFASLAQSLVNPVLKKGSFSNMIGQGGALKKYGGGFKGFTTKNPYLT